MVLYRRWRPQTLSEIVGQEAITKTLKSALELGKIAHAYLFSGPRGTGKTSTARIIAKAVNCLATNGKGEPCNQCPRCQAITEGRCLDVIEVDAASNRRIEEIRQLRERVAYPPVEARYKVYIIDECHMLTTEASNALLKTLEEPPKFAIFILATTEAHKVLPTILSRCQHFVFRRLSLKAISSRLLFIAQKEGFFLPEKAFTLIARRATGSMRDAENILEQLVSYFGTSISLEQASDFLGMDARLRALDLVRAILDKKLASGLESINQALADGLDLKELARETVDYLRSLLLAKIGAVGALDIVQEEMEEIKKMASKPSLNFLLKAVKNFSAIELRSDSSLSLALELALLDTIGEEEISSKPEPILAKQTQPEERTPINPPSNAKGEGLNLAYIESRWREFVNSLRGKGSRGDLDARLRSACHPTSLEGNILELSFKYQSHLEKISDPKYRYLVEKGLEEFFGVPLKLKLSLKQSQKIIEEPMVQAALESGARIVKEE